MNNCKYSPVFCGVLILTIFLLLLANLTLFLGYAYSGLLILAVVILLVNLLISIYDESK